MNNETNNNQTNTNETPELMPMAGVTIAPPSEEPVNASNSQTAASAPPSAVLHPQEPTPAPTPVVPETTTEPVIIGQEPVAQPEPVVLQQEPVPPAPVVAQPKKKPKINIMPILIIIIIALLGYIVYTSNAHREQINALNYNCTPITASKEEIELDINSTLVQDLYNKVYTTIREDLAEPEFNNSMKLYLAYRQIPEKDIYTTNCNLFSTTSMEPYTCEVSTNFVPRAFKEERLLLELKKLFGEKEEIPFENIRLGRTSCIGGFQYIKERGEFVEGYCNQKTATSFKATKNLVKATSTKNTIILTEEVKYHENEKMNLPSYLKSGTYLYTFRLDMNYNYVLVSKTYESKY